MSYITSASAAMIYGQPHPDANTTPNMHCPCCGSADGNVNHSVHQSHGFFGRDHKPILAERFKTKMCKNFIEQGHCPYMFRCMFAHGDHELRTKQMNMADGLYTEEAIKAFKRARYEAERAALFAAGIVLASGRTRHDPYAQNATVWHPLGQAYVAAMSTMSSPAPSAGARSNAAPSSVASSSARSSPAPERSVSPVSIAASSSTTGGLFARIESPLSRAMLSSQSA